MSSAKNFGHNMDATPSTEPDEAAKYDVGYGKPPRSGQFKKGQSGHPRGRPKGSKSLARIIREGVATKIEAKVDGKVKTITMAEAVFMRLMREAAAGDARAATHAIRLMERYASDEVETPQEEDPGDLELLTSPELDELGRLCAKMRGNEAEWLEECRVNDEKSERESNEEFHRIFGANSVRLPKDPDTDIVCVYMRRVDYDRFMKG